jgi:hypothetical protein
MAATSTIEKKAETHAMIARERFMVSRKDEQVELVLRGTPRRTFSFTMEIDFPEVSFKDYYNNTQTVCMFTFIHDPNIRESTLTKLVEFKKDKTAALLKSAAESYEKGDKAKGDLNMKLARIVDEMQYSEGIDDMYAPRLMTVNTLCSNADFGRQEIRDGVVEALQEIGNRMKDVFEPKPLEPRK